MASEDPTPFMEMFSGRWRPAVDASLLGTGDFSTLTNMRYTRFGIKSVYGTSGINTTGLTSGGDSYDDFDGPLGYTCMKETFETYPGYDLGEAELEGWYNTTAPPPNPDATPPVGTTGWGSYCLLGSGSSEIRYQWAAVGTNTNKTEFSFGFKCHGDYAATYTYVGVFWAWGPSGINVENALIEIYSGGYHFYVEDYTDEQYTDTLAAGEHEFVVYVNLETGAWRLTVDDTLVGSGTATLSSYAGYAYTWNIALDENMYINDAWYCDAP